MKLPAIFTALFISQRSVSSPTSSLALIFTALLPAIFALAPRCGWASVLSDTVTVKLIGTVLDADTQEPLAFASVAVLNPADSTLIDGAVTDDAGSFALETARTNFLLRIDYLSYAPKYLANLSPSANGTVRLDKIYLKASDQMLEEVKIEGRRDQVEMLLDKKVFNVSEDISRFGGNAQNVLDNIPSVTVDVDGNVSLRGERQRAHSD